MDVVNTLSLSQWLTMAVMDIEHMRICTACNGDEMERHVSLIHNVILHDGDWQIRLSKYCHMTTRSVWSLFRVDALNRCSEQYVETALCMKLATAHLLARSRMSPQHRIRTCSKDHSRASCSVISKLQHAALCSREWGCSRCYSKSASIP